MRLDKQVLRAEGVRLEPLEASHREGLAAAIRDGELWTIRETLVPHPDDLDGFMQEAEDAFVEGRELAFSVFDTRVGRIVGSTRLMCIDRANRRCEIGFTFYAHSAQRTHVNTQCKYLLLQHAFERLEMNRVELITDVRNRKSRAAIARIGAQQEGVLRSHMILRDGHVRDSVLFSVVRDEWPEVKRALEARMAAHRQPS